MRLRPSPVPHDGFDSDSEQTGDADLAKRLTKLVGAIEGGSTILFDGPWGIGKTTFIRRWMPQLVEAGITPIYVDAFSIDYLESPFVAIAGAINEAASKAQSGDDVKRAKFVDAASKVGTAIALSAVKAGIKAATLGAVDIAGLEAAAASAGVAADTLSDSVEEWVRERISEHEKRKGEIDSLRSSLEELASSLVRTDVNNPLLLIIDELDRCRPDFAIGYLESIKHFFGADKVTFILVCHHGQLEVAVNHRYGAGINSAEYLRKFYDLRVDYQLDYNETHGTKLGSIIRRLSSEFLAGKTDERYVEQYVRDIARAYRLSLRDVEQIFSALGLAYATEGNSYRPAILVAFLAAMKLKAPELYLRAKSGELTYQEASEFVSNRNWRDFDDERLKMILRVHLDPNEDLNSDEYRSYTTDLWRYNLDRLNTLKFISNSIIDRFEVPAAG